MTATIERTDLWQLPHLTLLAYLEAIIIEKAYYEASQELGTEWPAGYCAEASVDLLEVLDTTLPEAGAAFIWGKFALRPPRYQWSHAWIELGDGTIIDLTASQFLPDQPKDCTTVLIEPTDPLADCYIETERNPAWARDLPRKEPA